MKTITILFLSMLLFASACKKDEAPNPTPTTLEEEIENIIQPLVDNRTTVGAAVGIIKPGGAQEMYFFGEKMKGQHNRPDEFTLYELGSISKTMTATILADLALKDQLSLEDPVEDYITEIENFPQYDGSKITFTHLANHSSSLPNIPDDLVSGNFDEDDPLKNYTTSQMLEFLDGYELTRPIGTEEEYSNLGMGLLGYTLAKIKGTSFEEQLHEFIFPAYDMTDAVTVVPAGYPNVAQPYNGHLKPVPAWDMSEAFLGAGGVKAHLKDMMKYLEVNMGYRDTPLYDALMLTHETTSEINYPVTTGLAWVNFIDPTTGKKLTWHNGGTAGSKAFIGFEKEDDIGVVLLFNTEINERTGTELMEVELANSILGMILQYQ